MTEKPQEPSPFARRDAETLLMLGGFMAILGLPVLVGTFWAGSGFAMGVNALSGLVLLGIGLGVILRGYSKYKRL